MGKRIAILGAGQLAKYLVQSSDRLGLEVTVVASSPEEPALQESCQRVIDRWTPELFLQVFQEHELVTFENEWISESLLSAVKERGFLAKLFPAFSSVQKVRTKWDQKEFFFQQGYPTARSLSCTEFEETIPFPGGVVLKESELAYDGKGVFVFAASDCDALKRKTIELDRLKRPWYLEEKIDFKQELALVFTRSRSGEFVHLPLVQFQSENGICSSVFVEGENKGLMANLEIEAVQMAQDLAEKLNWCGTAAIEFFYHENRGLLVNEFAPRVHNSGHFSLSASRTSQFENHLRAISGIGLGSYETAPFAMMKNLIGPEGSKKAVAPESRGKSEIFWYGKREVRPGRKMGHVNQYGELSDRKKIIDEVNQLVNQWQKSTIS